MEILIRLYLASLYLLSAFQRKGMTEQELFTIRWKIV
jgi:hypothetical protein